MRNLTDGTIIFTLEDNAALKNNLQGKQLPVTEYKNIMVDNEKQLMAPVRMTYSGSLAEGSKHPLLVEVYGGPGSQKVDYRQEIMKLKLRSEFVSILRANIVFIYIQKVVFLQIAN